MTGADSIDGAITLQAQLQDLFSCGGFLLRKWSSNEASALRLVPPELRECQERHPISDTNSYTKTLGLEWNTTTDQFRLSASEFPSPDKITKRTLVSDIAKVFDVLGWFAPAIIVMKILLQRLWELQLDWDEPVPEHIQAIWERWRSELPALSAKCIPRCYFPKEAEIVSFQVHAFSDASENAYAGVVYLRLVDSTERVYTSLVLAKTKVSPIKRLTIPRLELCGAVVLTRLLQHVKEVYNVPLSNIYAWTDSKIVLSWLTGNPRRFKTYVGNRISLIVDQIPPDRWSHVAGAENPADCASRGVFPAELLDHELWWTGPSWLSLSPSHWPTKHPISVELIPEEEKEICLITSIVPKCPLIPVHRYSTFTKLQRITAWILRFVKNCRLSKSGAPRPDTTTTVKATHLTVPELIVAERYWLKFSQADDFSAEITSLQANDLLPNRSCLLSLHPFLDSHGILRVGGRETHSNLSYAKTHPIILHGRNSLTKLII